MTIIVNEKVASVARWTGVRLILTYEWLSIREREDVGHEGLLASLIRAENWSCDLQAFQCRGSIGSTFKDRLVFENRIRSSCERRKRDVRKDDYQYKVREQWPKSATRCDS